MLRKIMDHVRRYLEAFEAWVRGGTPRERSGDFKRLRIMEKRQGPMRYIGDVICKRMQEIGYEAKVVGCWRSPEDQEEKWAQGFSKARAWQSPHQYYEAVDIAHAKLGWDVGPEFWASLVVAVDNTERDLGVKLVSGARDWGWDKAHVELADWRTVRDRLGRRVPSEAELRSRFREVLPNVKLPPEEYDLDARLREFGL